MRLPRCAGMIVGRPRVTGPWSLTATAAHPLHDVDCSPKRAQRAVCSSRQRTLILCRRRQDERERGTETRARSHAHMGQVSSVDAANGCGLTSCQLRETRTHGRCGEWYWVDGLRLRLTVEGDLSESTSLELRFEVTSSCLCSRIRGISSISRSCAELSRGSHILNSSGEGRGPAVFIENRRVLASAPAESPRRRLALDELPRYATRLFL